MIAAILSLLLPLQVLQDLPREWKWTSGRDFLPVMEEKAPSELFPVRPEGAENLTFSPDSSLLAFTRGGNLWVVPAAGGAERQLTFDGGRTVYNGFASWVYYEEIFGRPSRYRAFWWSPDSRTLAFYRFDDTDVPMFPIYSPFGQDGTLRETHYPKAGEKNPSVRIGFADLRGDGIVWADFDETEDQYFGTPFWSADSRRLFVRREPRRGNVYQGIMLDPPAYGHGPDGEKWKLDDCLYEMLCLVGQILAPKDSFLILNLYANGYSSLLADTALRSALNLKKDADIECGELVLRDSFGKALPLSVFARLKR